MPVQLRIFKRIKQFDIDVTTFDSDTKFHIDLHPLK
jgi:hypothetical protein